MVRLRGKPCLPGAGGRRPGEEGATRPREATLGQRVEVGRRRWKAASPQQASVGSKTRSAARGSIDKGAAVLGRDGWGNGGTRLDVVVRTRNIEVPEGIRAVTREKVSRLTRFLDGMDHAEVVFSEERNPRISEKERCEVTMAGHGHFVRAKAHGVDQLAAVHRVVDKLEHQIVRLKGKL